jgi:hypothetical protein
MKRVYCYILFFIVVFGVNSQTTIYPFHVNNQYSVGGSTAVEMEKGKIYCYVMEAGWKNYLIKYDKDLIPRDSLLIENQAPNRTIISELLKVAPDKIAMVGFEYSTITQLNHLTYLLVDTNFNLISEVVFNENSPYSFETVRASFNEESQHIVLIGESNNTTNYTFLEINTDGSIVNEKRWFTNIALQAFWQTTDTTYLILHKYSFSEFFVNQDTLFQIESTPYIQKDSTLSRVNFNRMEIKLSEKRHLVGGQIRKLTSSLDSTALSASFISMFELDSNMDFNTLFSYNLRESNVHTFPPDELVSSVPNCIYLTGMQDVNPSFSGGPSTIIEVFQLDSIGGMNWHNSIQIEDGFLDKQSCFATQDSGLVVFIYYRSYSGSNFDLYTVKFDKSGNEVDLSRENVGTPIFTISTDRYSISPNPSSSIFNIQLELSSPEYVDLVLRDGFGKKIIVNSSFSKQDNYNKQIDLSAFPMGVYYLDISIDGKTTQHKLLKTQ